MKKYFLFMIAGFALSAQAQEVSDAMRYAQDNLTGTARFRGMSGAFGALGGDFSAIGVNPAGSAVFTTNQIAITLSNYSISNKSRYFGTTTKERDNSFDLNQLGAIWVFENEDASSNWKKFTVAANYENVSNFDNQFHAAGFNPTNSVSQYFSSHANGIPLGDITNLPFEALTYREQQAYFGYYGYLINPANDNNNNNTIYTSNAPIGGNYYQENFIESTGYNGKLSFNGGVQLTDRFYFGLNLNSHFTDYTRVTNFYEDYMDTPGNNPNSGPQGLRFRNELYTYGNGFSFQIGAIAKVTPQFRVGVAYESPTWFRLNKELRQSMVVDCPDCGTRNPVIVDPNLTMIYPSYRLQTPGKYTGSLAYVFGKYGLISIDYAIKDYSNIRFRPSNDYRQTNAQLESLLDVTSEVRIGAEAKAKQWSFRGGYRFEQSPYKNGKTVGDLQGFSAGLGYNFGGTRLDAAYSYAKRDIQQTFFSQGLVDPTTVKTVSNNVTLTLLMDL
jgi:hypothetical protein